MKNAKKISVLILAALMASCMAGCSNSDSSSVAENETVSTTTSATTTTTTAATTTTAHESTTTTTTAPAEEPEKPRTSINEKNGATYLLIEGTYRKLDSKGAIRLACETERLEDTLANLRLLPKDREIVIATSREENYPYDKLNEALEGFEQVRAEWSGDDLSGVEQLTNLTGLDLSGFGGDDLSPISNLTNLTTLELGRHKVDDVTVFYNLKNLKELTIRLDEKYLVEKHYTEDDMAYHAGYVNTEDTYNEVDYSNSEIKKLCDKLDDCALHFEYENEYDYGK